MKFTQITLAAIVAFVSAALALAAPSAAAGKLSPSYSLPFPNLTPTTIDCIVNVSQTGKWDEKGLSRHRAAFSASGTDPAKYCEYWFGMADECYLISNIQCGWSDEIKTWHVDGSVAAGPGGDIFFEKCIESTRIHWQEDTGCATGLIV